MAYYKDKSKEELLVLIRNLERQIQGVKNEQVCGSTMFRDRYAVQILEALTDRLIIFDHQGMVVEMLSPPEAGDNASGLPQKRPIPLDELFDPEACSSLMRTIREVLVTGEPVVGEHAVVVDDVTRHFEHTVSPLGNEYLLCASRDISIRVKQRSEITRLHFLLNAVLNNIPIYLFVKDVNNDFRYQYWNKAFAIHSGIAAEDAIGRNDFELFGHTEIMERFRKEDLALLEKGRLEYEEETITASGERRVMITIKTAIFPNPKTPYIVGLSWDVTDIRRAEKKIIEARVKAEEADKLKSSFLANMSHEIRTPLNAIVGFSKLAIDAKNEEEKWNYIDVVDKNSQLLLNLFNDILDLSTIESDSLVLFPRPVILRELCSDQYELHRHTVQYGVKIILDDTDNEIWINADWNRLEQILSNLLNNAIKFTQKGEIHFGYERKEKMIRFYVKDTGIGISSDKVSNIFRRFGKVNNFVQGTGLGLSISHLLVEKMGGRIWVRSKPGEGTTFYFTIPFDQTI